MFPPEIAPPGRLLRLAVVLDQRNPPARIGQVALIAELAGIDMLWTSRAIAAAAALEPLTPVRQAVALAAQATRTIRLGAATDDSNEAAELAAGIGARLELQTRVFDVHQAATAIALPPHTSPASSVLPPRDADNEGRLRWERLGEGTPLWLEASSMPDLEQAAKTAHGVLLAGELAAQRWDTWRAAVADACASAGRPPSTLAVAVELPVSIGRTEAEAYARADLEPLFQIIGHPKDAGIYGTLEQCQERVIALSHAGVTELRCIVPNAPDVHDVLAQLTAMVAGSKAALQPGAARSEPPEPPSWAAPRA